MRGGERFTRAERSGDRRQFADKKIDRGQLLLRLWRYLGKIAVC